MSTGETWVLGRRPALDGLRGVAVLLVLAGHLRLLGANDEGKIGVAVFFTLSGFLITSLLLEEFARTQRIDLTRFYRRRALRLVPAQLACVVVVSVVGLALGPAFLTGGQVAAASLYLMNVMEGDGLLGHFWSLAVEEQFYLLWAPLVVVLARAGRRPVLGVATAGVAVALVVRWADVDLTVGPVAVQGFVAHVDGIMLGCALAGWMHGRRAGGRGLPAPIFTIALVALASLTWLPREAAAAWGVLAASVVTSILIWGVCQEGSRWLEGRWLRLVGQRSYAIYLWHYPLMVLLWVALGPGARWEVVALTLAGSAGLAALSWRYVEAPFLSLKDRGRSDLEDRESRMLVYDRPTTAAI